jgi:outer membrane protein assembly factor BamA
VPADDPQFVPTGGTSLIVLNAEYRMPSPFLGNLLRLVLFVDGGSIGTASLWDLGQVDMRFTPGAGVRFQTPVGPVRLDIGYNPHGRPAAPLLLTELETGVIRRVADEYRPEAGGVFSRMRVHLGVGHAF